MDDGPSQPDPRRNPDASCAGDAAPKTETPAAKKPSRGRHLLNFTLSGVPELEQFEGPDQRQEALRQIGDEAANLKTGGYWLAVAILVVSVFGAMQGVKWFLNRVDWPRMIEKSLAVVVCGLVFWFVLRWLHRRNMAATLRRKLVDQGVPVCVACGYSLKGLTAESGRCPECGRTFDDDVRAILRSTASSVNLP